MPQMLTLGTIGTSQWRYLAQRMEEALADLADSQAVTREALPSRLLEAARDFFANALNAHSGAGNDDPSVSIANYRLAAQALRSSIPTIAQESREKLIKTLEDYANLLASFAEERRLSEADLQATDQLKNFFHQLFARADVAAYAESVLAEDGELEGFPFYLTELNYSV